MSMQRTYGNRAVQRFLNNSLAAQRQTSCDRQAASAGQIAVAPSTSASPALSGLPSIQRQNTLKGGSKMAQSIAEKKAGEDVRDRGWRLPELQRELLHTHWSSPQERRAYTRRFLIAHWELSKGGKPDSLEIDMQMVQYEKLVLSKMPKNQADKELESAEEWMKQALKTPEEKKNEQEARGKGLEAWRDAEKKREEQEELEIEKELEKLEQQEYLEQQTRVMKVNPRLYYGLSTPLSGLLKAVGDVLIKLKEFMPFVGTIIDGLEAAEGRTLSGEKLKGWERALRVVSVVLDVIPGVGSLFSKGAKTAAKGIFLIAKQTGLKTKDILRTMRGLGKLSPEQVKLLKEAKEILKSKGTLSPKHRDAIKDALGPLNTGKTRSTARTGAKAGSEAAKEASEKAAKEAAEKKAMNVVECKSCKIADKDVLVRRPAKKGEVKLTKDGIFFCWNPCDGARKVVEEAQKEVAAKAIKDQKAVLGRLKEIDDTLIDLQKQEKAALGVGNKAKLDEIAEEAVKLKDEVQTKRFKTPMGSDAVIIDTNTAIALNKRLKGLGLSDKDKVLKGLDLSDGEKAMIARIEKLGDVELRLADRAAAELKAGKIEFRGVGTTVARNSAEYKELMQELTTWEVGKAKGAADRDIVTDAFFAATKPGVVPRFATHDPGIYNSLYRMKIGDGNGKKFGNGKKLAKMGKSVPVLEPNGFDVTVKGRTIHVLPLPKI